MRITDIVPGSPASRLGLRAGDTIQRMNGERVRDELDFQFHIVDDEVLLSIERDRRTFDLVYERGHLDGEFGVRLEDPKVRLCGNDCVFCFVDQSPPGMRKAVYVRDEDYRLSFLYGNFITLTNLKEWEIRRILTQRLSPLYVSVHSVDPAVREVLFGTAKAREILPRIDRFLDGGIELHTQVVLCPGFNDGPDLERTIAALAERIPRGLLSLAVVPVGLTMHRENLPRLEPATAETARAVYATIMPWQERLRRETGRGFVYMADEWYRLLEMETPAGEMYDGYPQLEDGIGLTRHFLDQLALDGVRIVCDLRGQGLRRVTMVTGTLFRSTLEAEMRRLAGEVEGLEIETVAVRNDFFGPSVTVAGLLAGRDILAQLEGRAVGERVCLPPVSLNQDGRFMDDMPIEELGRRLGAEVVAGFGVGSA